MKKTDTTVPAQNFRFSSSFSLKGLLFRLEQQNVGSKGTCSSSATNIRCQQPKGPVCRAVTGRPTLASKTKTKNRTKALEMRRGEKEATVICKGQQKEGRQIHESGAESSNWERLERKGIAEAGSLWHGKLRFNMAGSRKLLQTPRGRSSKMDASQTEQPHLSSD